MIQRVVHFLHHHYDAVTEIGGLRDDVEREGT